jgi:hypothetical protein
LSVLRVVVLLAAEGALLSGWLRGCCGVRGLVDNQAGIAVIFDL